jgi:hypothetical protein
MLSEDKKMSVEFVIKWDVPYYLWVINETVQMCRFQQEAIQRKLGKRIGEKAP